LLGVKLQSLTPVIAQKFHQEGLGGVMRRLRQYRGGFQFSGLVELARYLRRHQTSPEALLWELLRDRRLLGRKFRRQHQVGNYVADFYCREAQLVIECDGTVHDDNEQWQHDQKRDVYLVSQGLRVLRFSNDAVLNRTEAVLSEIAKAVTNALTPNPSPKGRGEPES
jgi:type I restriction enzyme R subunit